MVYYLSLRHHSLPDIKELLSLYSYSKQLYIDKTISRCSIITILILDTLDLKSALFLKVSFFFLLLALPVHVALILQQYTHNYSHRRIILACDFEALYSS